MTRILSLGQRAIIVMAALGTALLIAWGGIVVWQDPCRRGWEAPPVAAQSEVYELLAEWGLPTSPYTQVSHGIAEVQVGRNHP